VLRAKEIAALRITHRQREFAAFIRALLFLLPFLVLVALSCSELLFGIAVIDPWIWFLSLFPSLLIAELFGHRPLKKVQVANQKEMKVAIDELKVVLEMERKGAKP
jgi:hypothetical protein